MSKLAAALVAAFSFAAAASAAPASADPAAELHGLFDSEWERGLREDPVSASSEKSKPIY